MGRRRVHGEVHDRGRVWHAGRQGKRAGIEQREGERRAEPVSVLDRVGEAGRGGAEHQPGVLRTGQVVAVDLEVVSQHHVPDAEQPRDGRDGRRLEQPELEAPVEGVEEVGRRRRPVRDQLAGDIRPVGEAGRDRLDRVAPPVGREVSAGQLEDPRVVRPLVER